MYYEQILYGEEKISEFILLSVLFGVPNEIRTRVTAVKGRCPRPLDDGDKFYVAIALFYQ